MAITRIYVLMHPGTGEVRYVGKTTMRLCNRLAKHMECDMSTHSGRWINTLKEDGRRPIIICIEEAGENWADRERHWIRVYRNAGCRLTNLSLGGDGHNGFITSENTRKKLSLALKGRQRPPEVVRKMCASQKGRIITPEHRAKISATLKGRKLSPEHKAKSLAALKRRKKWVVTPEMREKISKANKGRKQTNEQRARNSASKKGLRKSPEHRKKLSESALLRFSKK